jgi:rhodanese-related sulfurtransferase
MLTYLVIGIVAAAFLAGGLLWRQRRQRNRELLAAHSIEAEELHRVLTSKDKPRIFDVRQPLDLLAYSEIIPGSERITPKEIIANPALIPHDEDAVVYCTCPGDKTAREIVEKAMSLSFRKIKILTGGLDAWKAKGYPTEKYVTAFHLDTPA